jgi:hypothetical protein
MAVCLLLFLLLLTNCLIKVIEISVLNWVTKNSLLRMPANKSSSQQMQIGSATERVHDNISCHSASILYWHLYGVPVVVVFAGNINSVFQSFTKGCAGQWSVNKVTFLLWAYLLILKAFSHWNNSIDVICTFLFDLFRHRRILLPLKQRGLCDFLITDFFNV